MGVYIKDMDMPNSCMACPLFSGNGCRATKTLFAAITNVASRVNSCPLTEVHEPHGRLIDIEDTAFVIPCDAEVVSAEAVQGWVPCSERLPSDDEDVIVSVLEDHGDRPWKYTTVAWLCNGVWISDNEILFGTAVAWMPLPKPYKGGDE